MREENNEESSSSTLTFSHICLFTRQMFTRGKTTTVKNASSSCRVFSTSPFMRLMWVRWVAADNKTPILFCYVAASLPKSHFQPSLHFNCDVTLLCVRSQSAVYFRHGHLLALKSPLILSTSIQLNKRDVTLNSPKDNGEFWMVDRNNSNIEMECCEHPACFNFFNKVIFKHYPLLDQERHRETKKKWLSPSRNPP